MKTFKSLFFLLCICLIGTTQAKAMGIKDAGEGKYELTEGDLVMVVDAAHGGKILSFTFKGAEVISQSRWPESFGSTFWTSPQVEWNWPPVPEYDKQPYTVEQTTDRLILTSQVSEKLKFRIRKEFASNPKKKCFVITYSIINEDNKERQVAPWEITRVTNDEGLIFFDAKTEEITPTGVLDFKPAYKAVWYHTDVTNENRKINADGKGWLAFCGNGLLLVKKFDDLNPSQPAPKEAEIQVYVNRGKSYIELESQGAYQTLKPGESLSMTVRWMMTAVDDTPQPAKKLLKTVKKMLK